MKCEYKERRKDRGCRMREIGKRERGNGNSKYGILFLFPFPISLQNIFRVGGRDFRDLNTKLKIYH